jgi:hypothetical protein
MPLEFALRPRFNLERPVPRRRVVRRRFLRFALPVAAYWLAIAGVTHAFLRSTAGERGASDAARNDSEALAPELAATEEAPMPAAPESPVDATAAEESPVASLPTVAAPVPSPEPPPEPAPPEPTPSPLAPLPPPAALPPLVPIATTRRTAPEPDLTPRRPAVAPLTPPPAPRVAVRTDRGVAASGPRISDPLEALAPPLDAPLASRSDLPPPPPRQESAKEEARAFSLPSCEAAAAAANETIDMQGSRGAPDLTRDAFASVLENGAYLGRCEIPARTALDVCAAVQNGKVVGITVSSTPRSPSVNACVRRAVVGLRFPESARLDVTRTRFAAAR